MVLKGTGVSDGVAIGPALLYRRLVSSGSDRLIAQTEVERELERYRRVQQQAADELKQLIAQMENCPHEAKIFKAHIDILHDPAIEAEIRRLVQSANYGADHAIQTVFQQFMDLLAASTNALTRERVTDLQDVQHRLLRLWSGTAPDRAFMPDHPVVLVADDLMPSDTASLDPRMVLGIVTENGGKTSHTAILSKTYGIPAVLGVPQALSAIEEQAVIIVDGSSGDVVVRPDAAAMAAYQAKRDQLSSQKKEQAVYLSAAPVTSDGIYVQTMLNIGSAESAAFAYEPYADGVGLFRTEFLYMNGQQLPDESEQFEAYRKVAEAFGEKRVVIRTLDIGGDKALKYLSLPQEQNPFLGLRALRFCFDQMPIFKTQIRAILRAALYGNLAMMFPMVGSLGDIRFAKSVVEAVRLELEQAAVPYKKDIEIGIMVEIPSIALMADIVAEEVDFASIGTNDLCQYLTAVDRLNPKVAKYYQSFHPAMFRLISSVVRAFDARHKPIGVCGEMGGDPLGAVTLIGLGIRKLSMNPAALAEIKRYITGINISKAERMAKTVLNFSTAAQVESYLRSELSGSV